MATRLSHRCFAAVILVAGISSAAIGDGYRCTEGGKTVYSDKPCQGGADMTSLRRKGPVWPAGS